MNQWVPVVEIANTVLQIAHALMCFGLADAAGGMCGVRGKSHNCRDQTAGIQKRALDPRIRERYGSVRDEIWRMQVKKFRVALVKKRIDRFSPLAALHVMNHNAVVILVELSEKKQSFGAPMAADELVHRFAMHHAAAFSQEPLKFSHSTVKLCRIDGIRAELGEMQLSQPRANHRALCNITERQVREFVHKETHKRLPISRLLNSQNYLLERNICFCVPAMRSDYDAAHTPRGEGNGASETVQRTGRSQAGSKLKLFETVVMVCLGPKNGHAVLRAAGVGESYVIPALR